MHQVTSELSATRIDSNNAGTTAVVFILFSYGSASYASRNLALLEMCLVVFGLRCALRVLLVRPEAEIEIWVPTSFRRDDDTGRHNSFLCHHPIPFQPTETFDLKSICFDGLCCL